jgi:HEAT repeat protein
MTTTGDEPRLGGQSTPGDAPRLGGEAALLHAIEALNDRDAAVRNRALTTLAERGDVRVFDLLVDMVNQNRQRVRAIRLLGKLKDPRATELLLRQLGRHIRHVEVLAATLQALADSGDRRAIDPIKTFLLANLGFSRPSHQRLWRQAVLTLKQLNDELLVYELSDLLQQGQTEVIPLLGTLGSREAVPVLLEQLQYVKSMPTEYVITKNTITYVLGDLGDPRAVEPLLELLREPYRSRCRYSSHDTKGLMMALAKMGDSRAVIPIVKILKHGNADERRSAAAAMAQLNHESGVPSLIEALGDDTRAVRLSVVEALGKLFDLSPSIREALLEHARKNDQGVRSKIMYILQATPEALAALQERHP